MTEPAFGSVEIAETHSGNIIVTVDADLAGGERAPGFVRIIEESTNWPQVGELSQRLVLAVMVEAASLVYLGIRYAGVYLNQGVTFAEAAGQIERSLVAAGLVAQEHVRIIPLDAYAHTDSVGCETRVTEYVDSSGPTVSTDRGGIPLQTDIGPTLAAMYRDHPWLIAFNA